MKNRYIYLAGPIEYQGDTWRKKASVLVKEHGFVALDPLRNENIKKVGKHLESDFTDKGIVRRDLDDLNRTRLSGGLMIANLNKTADGRECVGTLFEMMYAYDHQIPVISIMGKACPVNLKTHPWILYCSTYETTSLTGAVECIVKYFLDEDVTTTAGYLD